MTRLAIDVDDTLYSFANLARQVLADEAIKRGDRNLERAAYASWDEWRTPNDLLGTETWLEIIAITHQPETIMSQVPFPGAAEILSELVKAGHDLTYISNRDPSTFHATAVFLHANGFPLHYGACHREEESGVAWDSLNDGTADGLVETSLICTSKPKMPFIADCQYLIDDRPKTIFEFLADRTWDPAQGERKAFSLITPYNRALTDVPGVFLAPRWSLLRTGLAREGVLDADRHPAAV